MKYTLKISLLIIACFALYYIGSKQFKDILLFVNGYTGLPLLSYLLTYLLIGIPIFAGAYFVSKPKSLFDGLGLNGSIWTGLYLGILFTLPMFLGSALIGTIVPDVDDLAIRRVIKGTLFAGFFEELYFRAFLFGMIFRKTRIGFIPAVVIGAVVFALGHLYQSDNTTIQWGIFMVTFLGAGYFAWLYVEWNYNLWVPIFLHVCMNASWMIFDVSDNAMGGIYVNIFRLVTIAISILYTVRVKYRKAEPLVVNKSKLILKSEAQS